MKTERTTHGSIKISTMIEHSLIIRHYYSIPKEKALESFKIEIEEIEKQNEILKQKKTKEDLKLICKLFGIGKLLSYKIEPHNLPDYSVANFETSKGNYQHIFKN